MSNPSDQAKVSVGPAVVDGSARSTRAADVRITADAQAARDRSRHINEGVEKWSRQQDADRSLRQAYARLLIWGLYGQAILVNAAFFAIGMGKLTVDAWTARIFIMAVFGELAAMVFFIVKYLFRSTGDEIIKHVGQMAADAVPSRRRG
jgi:hypothetical protein